VGEEGSGKKSKHFFLTSEFIVQMLARTIFGEEKMSIIHVNQMLYNVVD